MSVVHLTSVKDYIPLAGASFRRDVDIVVPIYKCVSLAKRCLDSLIEHIGEISQCNPRLIVINDSPGEPDVDEMLKSFADGHPIVTILENDTNQGFVRTANRGLEIALHGGRDALLVNADTETFPGTLKTLIDVAYSDTQIGFVSPRSNNASICSLPHSFGGAPADPAESYRRWKLLSRTMPPVHPVPTAVGFYLFIKHAVLANFGFMDPEFGVGYEEENDLILRANKVGYRAVIANHAFAYHVGSASFALHNTQLEGHRALNLNKLAQRHPEFLPLVTRYESSAHFRAETLISNLLIAPGGRSKIVFDFSMVGPNVNGTGEMSVAILKGFHRRHASRYDISVICSDETFKFYELRLLDGVRRHEPNASIPERFLIGVNLGQPFTIHQISLLEDLAVVNIYGMLDTIAEDCGYLSITHRLDTLWGYAARHANGLMFNSEFSEGAFLARHGEARNLSRYARLLPTKLSSYRKNAAHEGSAEHVLILGNHFAHKASESTARILRGAFPTIRFAVLGGHTGADRNVLYYQSGSLGQQEMDSLYNRASVVVLPSHVEGFGFGLMHGLAAHKVVVARDIPATREILATYKRTSGVFLYSDDGDVVRALRDAMGVRHSEVDDSGAEDWGNWVDGFEKFCEKLVAEEDVFERLLNRIQAGDLIRRSELLEHMQSGQQVHSTRAALAGVFFEEDGRAWIPARHIDELLALDGDEFIYKSYVSILDRLPDQTGLKTYRERLKSGAHKIKLLKGLKRSEEGRQRPLLIVGFWRVVTTWYLRTLGGLLG